MKFNTLFCGLSLLLCFSYGAGATGTVNQIAGFDTDCSSEGQLFIQMEHFNNGWRTMTFKPVTFDNQPVLCKGGVYINRGKELNKYDLETALLQSAGLKKTADVAE